MEFQLLVIYLLLGILGGLLSGLLGVGGGIIFIPVFDQIFRSHGIEGEELVRYILANSFLAMLVAGISSSLKHGRMGNFHLKEVLTIAIPATIVGSILSGLISTSSWYKESHFKLLFIAIILITLWRSWVSSRKESTAISGRYSRRTYGLIGIVTGVVSAFSGLGGGIVMIPLLTLFAKIDIKKASAISIGVIPIMIAPFLVVYALQQPSTRFSFGLGYLQFQFCLPVIAGILFGSPFGVRMAQRIKSSNLQLIFAALLIIIVSKYIYEMIVNGLV